MYVYVRMRKSYFSSRGMSKKLLPSLMTSSHSSSEMPTFLRYKKPTSMSAFRSWSRNSGLVAGFLDSARSRMGMDVNDMTLRG